MPSGRREVPGVTDGDDDVVRSVVSTILRDRDRLIAELSASMRAQVAALDSDTRLRGLFEAGTTDNLMSVLDFVQNDAAEHEVHAPARALVYARTLAQRDVPLSALIRAYRVGHAGFLDVAMRYAVELGGPDSAAAIIRIVNRTAVYIDRNATGGWAAAAACARSGWPGYWTARPTTSAEPSKCCVIP
jgi:hypothetical protein